MKGTGVEREDIKAVLENGEKTSLLEKWKQQPVVPSGGLQMAYEHQVQAVPLDEHAL